MTGQDYTTSLQDGFARLRAAIIADIKCHLSSLHQSDIEFYGYAILPPDYYRAFDPTTIAIAFNREIDIATENCGSPYYRYSVDEWQNYVHEGFETVNCELKALLATTDLNDEDSIDEAFVDAVYEAVLDAMLSLRNDKAFANVRYLVIWLPDSSNNIVNRSAKLLNDQDVYDEFASEFIE
jgi:hypothetical protein